MTKLAPDDYIETKEESIEKTKAFVNAVRNRNVKKSYKTTIAVFFIVFF